MGFDVYETADLAHFTEPYPAFRPPDDFWAQTNFWAPEVYKHDSYYYMFATFQPISGRRGTAILRAENPTGPYVPWSDGPVTPSDCECLDGTFHVISYNNYWLIFCHEWKQVGDGRICAVRLSNDLRHTVGDPVTLFSASSAPWAFPLKGRALGSYVTDGPFLYTAHDGSLYLLWSSFGENGNYCIGYAVSSDGTLFGEWKQSQKPLYESDGGHGMLFRDLDGRLLLAIHSPNKTPRERAHFIEIKEMEGGLSI